jgi:hypothetical protein
VCFDWISQHFYLVLFGASSNDSIEFYVVVVVVLVVVVVVVVLIVVDTCITYLQGIHTIVCFAKVILSSSM